MIKKIIVGVFMIAAVSAHASETFAPKVKLVLSNGKKKSYQIQSGSDKNSVCSLFGFSRVISFEERHVVRNLFVEDGFQVEAVTPSKAKSVVVSKSTLEDCHARDERLYHTVLCANETRVSAARENRHTHILTSITCE